MIDCFILTFLHGLKRVVGFNEFDGVCDTFILQDVIAQTQIGNGQLKHLRVPNCVLLKDRTCTEIK